MPTFIMLTRLAAAAARSPVDLESLEHEAAAAIRKHCPDVEWKANYAVLGPYDYLDIFEAPNIETATKVSALVRTFGYAQTEIWPATDWQRFKALIRDLSPAAVPD